METCLPIDNVKLKHSCYINNNLVIKNVSDVLCQSTHISVMRREIQQNDDYYRQFAEDNKVKTIPTL